MTDSNKLRRILHECKTMAVIGLSANEMRPSYFAAKYMQDHGYRIIPVNPNYDEILGEKCYADLGLIPYPVDMVDLFQRADRVRPFVEQAIEIDAKVVWMQLGVINQQAANLASDAGLEVVMDKCVKIEYARLFGGLNWVGVDTKVISAKRPLYVNH
ncbi:MAG: CoA-binding protein [Gammaproteobacteria bacterium]|nr:CoA-binding protein [Gammaproteobacteria bacterium]